MAGYPEVEDVPAHASVKWLNDILRQDIGFASRPDEGRRFRHLALRAHRRHPEGSRTAGLEGRSRSEHHLTSLPTWARWSRACRRVASHGAGDRALRRVLELKFRLGLFENPYVDPDRAVQVMHSEANRDLGSARRARESCLLKNEKNLLPLKKDLKSDRGDRPNADDVMNPTGRLFAQAVITT